MPAPRHKTASLTLPLLVQSEDSHTSPLVQIHVGAGSPEPGAKLPSPQQQWSCRGSQDFTTDPCSATPRTEMMIHCPTAAAPPPTWPYSACILAVRVGEISHDDTPDISPTLDHSQTPSDSMPGPVLSQQHDTGAADASDVSHATTARQEPVPADVPVTFIAAAPAPAAVPASPRSCRVPALTGLQAAIVVALLASCCLGFCLLVSPCLPPASQQTVNPHRHIGLSSISRRCLHLPALRPKPCCTCPSLRWMFASWQGIP